MVKTQLSQEEKEKKKQEEKKKKQINKAIKQFIDKQTSGDNIHLVDYILTQEDLENNPELVDEGLVDGDIIGIPFPIEKSKEDSKPATPPEDSVYKQVKYEGKTVVEVLQQGHTDTHYHCKMSDNSTMHVPRSEFK